VPASATRRIAPDDYQ